MMTANHQSPKRERGVDLPKRGVSTTEQNQPASSNDQPVANAPGSDCDVNTIRNHQSPKRERGVDLPERGVSTTEQQHHPSPSDKPVASTQRSDCASAPLAYLITFTTYGTWLPGDERGSVDDDHNVYNTPYLARNPQLENCARSARKVDPVLLGKAQRDIVGRTIAEVCKHRDWFLHELNVRTNHVHVVVSAPCAPEHVMNSFKSWATRNMRGQGLCDDLQSPWTKHGSTRYLWKPIHLARACAYVAEGQGQDL